MRTLSALLLSALLAFGMSAGAQSNSTTDSAPAVKKADTLNGEVKPERGWWFFDDPKKPEPELKEDKPVVILPPTSKPPLPKEQRCKEKSGWSADCGFVDPGSDFEFQAKQRDALMERMVVSKNDPKAVEAFQYYMRWVLDRSSEVANLWWYNQVQNPELDPSVQQPISAFGLRLMSDVRAAKNSSFFNMLKDEGAFFVYFSRTDCVFCHQMTEPLRMLETNTGLPIRNASLDDKCMPTFQGRCSVAPATLQPAQALKVETVPAVFLYVPGNTWLRIATGATDTESMANRTFQFFTAYRNALLTGVNNGSDGKASVDFSKNAVSGVGEGIAKVPGKAVRPPTASEVSAILGASN